MSFPGEELVTTAIEKLSDGIIKKMEDAEARRDREFAYKLKELEFYKSSYDKELKDIFDYWFETVRVTYIKDNAHLTEEQKKKYQKKYDELVNVEKIARYKMNTLKYAGTETAHVFAIQNKLLYRKEDKQPKQVSLFIWCAILAVLKKEVLGQELDPCDLLRSILNDYDEHEEEIEETKKYIRKIYKETYSQNPYWIK